MPFPQRNYFFALVLLAAVAANPPFGGSTPAPTFTPYAAPRLPQRAFGDFDGDGRIDVARILDQGAPYVSVLLSASSTDVRLDAPVAQLIGGDVDQDGDIDLVAATATGDVLIWLNDGHGRFVRREPSRSHGFSSDQRSVQKDGDTPSLLTLASAVINASNRSETRVAVTPIRPPSHPLDFDLRFQRPQNLRAPPPAVA